MALYNNMIGHSLEKFAGVTVFDATFYDSNNRPLITFDSLQVSNISVDASVKEIRGGQGASLLLTYDYDRTAEIEITDALASMYSLQYLWGGKLRDGDVTALLRREFEYDGKKYTAPGLDETKPVTVLHRFADGSEELVQKKGPGTPEAPARAAAGDRYVIYYTGVFTQGESGDVQNSHVHELTLTSTDFPSIMKLVGDTFFVDAKTGRKVAAQVEIPRFKPAADFTFTFEAEGEASVFDFTGTALASGNEILKLKTLGYLDEMDEEGAIIEHDTQGKNPEDDTITLPGETT